MLFLLVFGGEEAKLDCAKELGMKKKLE